MEIAPPYRDTYEKLKKMKPIKCSIIKNAHCSNEDEVYYRKNLFIKGDKY